MRISITKLGIDKRILIFILSLLISFLFLGIKDLLVHEVLNVEIGWGREFGDYTPQVKNLLKNNSFMDEDGKILNRYPPLYSLLLYSTYKIAGFIGMNKTFSLFVLSALFIALSSVIIFEIANLLYKEEFALMASLIFMTHPYILQGISKIMSVTPFNTFFYFGFFLLFKMILQKRNLWYIYLFSGILFGAAMLIRPIGLFIPLLFFLLLIIVLRHVSISKRLGYGGLILLGSILTILPWQYYNFKHNQMILLSSDEVASMIDGVKINNDPQKQKLNLPKEVERLTIDLSSNQEIKSRGDLFKHVWKEFQKQPVTVLKLIGIKAIRSWYGSFGQEKNKERIKIIILVIYFIPMFISFFFIDYKDERWRIFSLFLIGLTLYFWAMTVLVVSMVRYMIPVLGLLIVFIPKCIERVLGCFNKKKYMIG